MKPIVVRRLSLADLPLLEAAPPDVFDDPVVPASARAFLERDGNVLVAAITDDADPRIVGFVSGMEVLHPDKGSPEFWINEVGVAEPYRRRGIGRQLMDRTLEIARALGCHLAWLAVDEDNAAALGLYAAAGGAPPERQIHIDFDLEPRAEP